MLLNINKDSIIPIYLQIKNQIRDMIIAGSLPNGFQLPPERKMAETLQVNRSTVLNAYRELKADGLIDSHIGRGTIVMAPQKLAQNVQSNKYTEAFPWRQFCSQNALRTKEPLLRDLMELANREDVISFAAGIAIPELDPLEELMNIQTEIFTKHGRAILQHTPTEGHYSLRESISQLLLRRGISAIPEELVVLSGSQQGIDLAARIFIDPGDVVVVEEPTFFSALQIFKVFGARILGVPVDENGIKTDLLEQLLGRYKPKFIYTMPTFQNPSGVVMSIERRRQLLNLAYKYQVPIIEDDPYGELRYKGNALPPLKALDTNDYVIYLSTFSKFAFPGFRVGYLAASRTVIKQFALTKQMADLHTGSLTQWLLDGFIRKGLLTKHINVLIQENSKRMKAMQEALERYAPKGVSWNYPEGGLYIWCRIPDNVIQSQLLIKATEYKVAFVPGEAFYQSGEGENYIRLNFTYPSPEKIHEGIKRLMNAVRELIENTHAIFADRKIEIKPIV